MQLLVFFSNPDDDNNAVRVIKNQYLEGLSFVNLQATDVVMKFGKHFSYSNVKKIQRVIYYLHL